jgi:uncharacterized protein
LELQWDSWQGSNGATGKNVGKFFRTDGGSLCRLSQSQLPQARIEWDKAKNRSNTRKHGLDFADAEEMFRGFLLARPDTREDYGEERWIGIGMIQGRCAFVAFAPRPHDTIRIISLRKADREEREEYEKAIQNGLEAH